MTYVFVIARGRSPRGNLTSMQDCLAPLAMTVYPLCHCEEGVGPTWQSHLHQCKIASAAGAASQ